MATTMPTLPSPTGKPVLGNTGLPNPSGSSIANPLLPGTGGLQTGTATVGSANPFMPAGANPGASSGNVPPGGINLSGAKPVAIGAPVSGAIPTAGGTAIINATPVVSGPFGGASTGLYGAGTPTSTTTSTPTVGSNGVVPLTGGDPGGVSQEENKQLVDIYGKGTGNLLSSEIANLGSNDSSYMQAYKNAMAGTNAENLATLNTTLGNEGVSGNSSAAAISNADFQSNVTAQEGLQEQQLQMNDLQNLLGLTQSTMDASESEVSTSVLGDIGKVVGGLVPGLSGLSGIQGGGVSASGFAGLANSMSAPAVAGLNTSTDDTALPLLDM